MKKAYQETNEIEDDEENFEEGEETSKHDDMDVFVKLMKTNNYRVVIPTAGIGSRVSPLIGGINKGLVTIGNKPALALEGAL